MKNNLATHLALGIFVAAGLWTHAQLPVAQLNYVFPTGARQGTTVEVTVSGSGLDGAERLYFSHSGIVGEAVISQALPFETTARPEPGKFKVSVNADVPPGFYDVRVVGRFGPSNPRTFVVGDLEEQLESGSNQELASAPEIQLGTVINGQANSEAFDYYRIPLGQGQRVIMEVWAQRIDSRLDATIVLLDEHGRELARNRDMNRYDPLLDFTAPQSGLFGIKVHDMTYRGGPEYFYRLQVSAAPYIDFVMPPTGPSGMEAQFTLYGRNLPDGKATQLRTVDGKVLEALDVEIAIPKRGEHLSGVGARPSAKIEEAFVDGFVYRLQSDRGVSNPVLIGFAPAILEERQKNDTPAEAEFIPAPCEVAGQFYPSGDMDWFRFNAEKGRRYAVEVISQRAGSSTDPRLLVQRVDRTSEGKEEVSDVTEADDVNDSIGSKSYSAGTRDPVLIFTATEGGEHRIMVQDLYGGNVSNPDHVYRLAVRYVEPDFRLVAISERLEDGENEGTVWPIVLRPGGTVPVRVWALRQEGFEGAITLRAQGLPEGVSATEVRIPAGASEGVIIFSANTDANAALKAVEIIGVSEMEGKAVERRAIGASLIWSVGNLDREQVHSRIVRELVLGVSGAEPAPLSVRAAEERAYEGALGGKVEIPLEIQRRGEFKGEIKLRPAGLVGLQKAPEIVVKTDESTAKLVLDLAEKDGNKFSPGEYQFHLLAEAEVMFSNDPAGAKMAEEEKQRLEKIAADLAAAAKAAADVAASASAEAKEEASKLAAEAETQAKLAEQARQAATKRAQEAAEANKPRDIKFKAYSFPIQLRITAAPAE